MPNMVQSQREELDGSGCGVVEELEDEFARVHMLTLRFYISLSHLHDQRRLHQTNSGMAIDENERLMNEEFEIELQNLHDLLANEHLHSVDILLRARASIEQYVNEWPGAAQAMDRWWHPRRDKDEAVRADVQLVVPGLWIGSRVTLEPQFEELLLDKRIRHVVYCKTTTPDADDDFLQGCGRVNASSDSVERTTLIEANGLIQSQERHTITLWELGPMEFLVRRREKTLPMESSIHAIDSITRYLQRIRQSLEQTQYKLLADDETRDTYVDQFDGVLLYCDSGVSTSIAVCVALVMAEQKLPYAVALRVVQCARRYVAPSEYLQHQLQEYWHQLIDVSNSEDGAKLDK